METGARAWLRNIYYGDGGEKRTDDRTEAAPLVEPVAGAQAIDLGDTERVEGISEWEFLCRQMFADHPFHDFSSYLTKETGRTFPTQEGDPGHSENLKNIFCHEYDDCKRISSGACAVSLPEDLVRPQRRAFQRIIFGLSALTLAGKDKIVAGTEWVKNSFKKSQDEQLWLKKIQFLEENFRNVQDAPQCSLFHNLLAEELGNSRILTSLCMAAEQHNTIIRFRPVNTRSLIRYGTTQNPTKDRFLKAKTSEMGHMAGFIPLDSELSKIFFRPEGQAKSDALAYNHEEILNAIKGNSVRPELLTRRNASGKIEFSVSCKIFPEAQRSDGASASAGAAAAASAFKRDLSHSSNFKLEEHWVELDVFMEMDATTGRVPAQWWENRKPISPLRSGYLAGDPQSQWINAQNEFKRDFHRRVVEHFDGGPLKNCAPSYIFIYNTVMNNQFPNEHLGIVGDVDTFSVSPLISDTMTPFQKKRFKADMDRDKGHIAEVERELFETANRTYMHLAFHGEPVGDPKKIIIHHGPEQHNPYVPNLDDVVIEVKPHCTSLGRACRCEVRPLKFTGKDSTLVEAINESIEEGRLESPSLRWLYDPIENPNGAISFCDLDHLKELYALINEVYITNHIVGGRLPSDAEIHGSGAFEMDGIPIGSVQARGRLASSFLQSPGAEVAAEIRGVSETFSFVSPGGPRNLSSIRGAAAATAARAGIEKAAREGDKAPDEVHGEASAATVSVDGQGPGASADGVFAVSFDAAKDRELNPLKLLKNPERYVRSFALDDSLGINAKRGETSEDHQDHIVRYRERVSIIFNYILSHFIQKKKKSGKKIFCPNPTSK